MKKALLYLFLFINLIAVAALFIAYLSAYIPPDKFWIPSFFGLAYPFILAANILFIIFWMLFKPRYLFLSFFSILIGWGFVSRYIQFKGENTEKGDVKVMSYNVKTFYGDGSGTQKENAEKIISFLAEQKPDIICLQEVTLHRNRVFNLEKTIKSLNSISNYQYALSSPNGGMVTISRYPILNMGEIRIENPRNMSIYTDVLIKEDTVRIFNVHLQSYQIEKRQYSIIDSLGIDQEKDIKEVREMGSKFKKAFQMRAKQVREIRKIIDKTNYGIIICGDFNDTPVSYAYQKLRRNLTDAFVGSGKGIGRTYNGKLPSFRIDNIFHSKKFESYNFQTYDFQMSDHLPVSCELKRK